MDSSLEVERDRESEENRCSWKEKKARLVVGDHNTHSLISLEVIRVERNLNN